jgi:hypothetical protein
MFSTVSSPRTISCSGENMLTDLALATMVGGAQSCARAGCQKRELTNSFEFTERSGRP